MTSENEATLDQAIDQAVDRAVVIFNTFGFEWAGAEGGVPTRSEIRNTLENLATDLLRVENTDIVSTSTGRLTVKKFVGENGFVELEFLFDLSTAYLYPE